MKGISHHINKHLPLLNTLRNYKKDTLKGDVAAGITVGIMLIPQGMAYAVLAGMPPVYGLYASILPLLIYALMGTSRQLAVGPVAMVSLLVVAGVGELAEVGSDRFIQLAILTAFGVGIVQFLMGVFRMGFLVNFLSHPVLSGFTSAAAIIIGASQIKNLTGLDIERTNKVHEILHQTAVNFTEIDLITASIGFGSILAMVLIKKWKRTLPSALVVVVAGILVTYLFGLNQYGVNIVGEIPKGLPSFSAEFLQMSDIRPVIAIVLVIALVSYMESIAVAKAIANKHGYKVDANQELIALGGANIGGSFFQSFPVTGGFSRTAVNDQSGANTTVASVVSALLIALTVLFLTPLFYYLPGAVLAAIIMVAVAGLFDHKEMVKLWKTDRKDLAMLIVTFAATLFLGIEEGIAIGVILSLVVVIYSSTKPHYAEVGRLGDSDTFRNIKRFPEAKIKDEILIYRFDSNLYFANVEFFRETIDDKIFEHGESLELVILDGSAMTDIDSTGVDVLNNLVDDLQKKGIKIHMAGVHGPVRDKLQLSGIADKMNNECFFFDITESLKYHQEEDKELLHEAR